MDNFVRRGRGVRGIGGSRGRGVRLNVDLSGDSAVGLVVQPSMEQSSSGQSMPADQVGTSERIHWGQVAASGSEHHTPSWEISPSYLAAQASNDATESEGMEMDIASQMAMMNLRTSTNRGGWPCSFEGLIVAQETDMDDDDSSDDPNSGEGEAELPFDAPPRSESPLCPVKGFFAGFYELGGLNILVEDHRLVERYISLSHMIDHWAPKKGALPISSLTPNKSFVIARIETGSKENSNLKCIRAKVVGINHEFGTVTVRNLDVIEKWNHTVTSNEIFWMTPEFKRLPLKVNVCKILGLERWSETRVCQDLLRLTSMDIGDRLNIIKSNTDRANDCLVIDAVCDAVNVNGISYERVLLSTLFKHLLGRVTRIPEVFYPKLVIDFFHLNHVETTTGMFFFTMHASWEDKLMYRKPDNTYFAPTPADHPDLHQANRSPKFLARSSYSTSDVYYRARVIDYPQPDMTVKVQFVDYGNVEMVRYAEMISIANVDPSLELPIPQVYITDLVPSVFNRSEIECGNCIGKIFQGRLNGIKSIVDVDQFFNRIPGDLPQRGMVTHVDEDGVPNIELYAKHPQWQKWACVNELGLKEEWASPSVSPIYQPCFEFMTYSTEHEVWHNYMTGVRLRTADRGAVEADLQPYSSYISLF